MKKNQYARRAVVTACLAGALALAGTPAHAENWPEEPGPETTETVTSAIADASPTLGAELPSTARVMDEPEEPSPVVPEPEVPVTPTPPVVPEPEAPAVPQPVPQPQTVPVVNATALDAADASESVAAQSASLAVTGGNDIAFWGSTAAGLLVASAFLMFRVRRTRARRFAAEGREENDDTETDDTRP